LYETEVIYHDGPWRGLEPVEYATLEWVAWFNSQRLLEPLGYVPPMEYEEQFHRTRAAQPAAGALT
jgi:transposase InsO family protein